MGILGSILSSGFKTALGGLPGAAMDGLLSFGSNALNSSKELSSQKKLMDYQNDINLRNWQLQNEYNSPKNQMKLLKEAGLNPNLAYANLANSASASVGSVSHGSVSSRQSFGQIAQYQMAAAQIDNLKAQNDNLKAQNKLIAAQENKTNAEAKRINGLYDYEVEKSDYENTLLSLGVKKSLIDMAYYNSNQELFNTIRQQQVILNNDSHSQNLLNQLQTKYNISATKASILLTSARSLLAYAQKNLVDQQVEESKSRVALNEKNILYVAGKLSLIPFDKALKNVSISKGEAEYFGKQLNNYLQLHTGNTQLGKVGISTILGSWFMQKTNSRDPGGLGQPARNLETLYRENSDILNEDYNNY